MIFLIYFFVQLLFICLACLSASIAPNNEQTVCQTYSPDVLTYSADKVHEKNELEWQSNRKMKRKITLEVGVGDGVV